MRRLALAATFAALALTTQAYAQAADPLRTAFAGYAVFQDDMTVIRDADVDSVSAMNLVLERTARHEPGALSRGFVAYGALSAAQSRAFADGINSRVRAAGRAAVLRQLRRDMGYARRRPPGSAEAIRLILDAAAADGARLDAVAARYDSLGRALQNGPPLHPTDAERSAREARLRALAATTPAPPSHLAPILAVAPNSSSPLSDVRAFGGRYFWDGLSDAPFSEGASPPAWRERAGRSGTIDNMLTLAALFIIGASDDETARIAAALDDPPTQQCLIIAQLHFRQCVSVAYGADEDAFCLARHGLRDQGACFSALVQAP